VASRRAGVLALGLILLLADRASAEWQIKPFVGGTFGGSTSLVDLEHASGHGNIVWGVTGMWLGEFVGVEGDFGRAPGFFEAGQNLVFQSGVTTLTGNVVVAVPKRLVEYTLRPYVVGGAGVMHAHSENTLGVLQVDTNLPAVDVGGGVTGFLTNRIGLSWDLRYFWSVGGSLQNGVSFGPPQLSFWRGYMAVAVRF